MPAAHTPPATQPLKNSVRLNGTCHHALKNRNEDDCKENQSKTSHQLLHALRFRTWVVIAVTFKEVDNAPDTDTCTDQADYRFQYSASLMKEEVSTSPVAAKACVVHIAAIEDITVAVRLAFFAKRLPLASHLCFDFVFSTAVSETAVMTFTFSIVISPFCISIYLLLKTRIKKLCRCCWFSSVFAAFRKDLRFRPFCTHLPLWCFSVSDNVFPVS